MSRRGKISHQTIRVSRWLVGLHLAWSLLLCVMGIWWGSLILSKSARIVELERQLNPAGQIDDLARTRRMITAEALVFLSLVLGGTGLLILLYRRDTQRARSIQAFFASVTHELRTPLTSIRLQAESIADTISGHPGGATAEELQLIQRLLEDTTRLQSQVEQTLELARVEGGGPVLTQPIHLRSWLERSRKLWLESQRGRLEIELHAGDDLLVHADPSAIQIILRNLIENALRHGRRESVKVRIETQAQSGEIAVLIRDNGEGFQGDSKSLGRLFEKGAQSQGAGVGLYLVRVLMQRMGGRAEFQVSQPAVGFETTLWFKDAPDSLEPAGSSV